MKDNKIRIDNITFGFPETDEIVFKDLALDLPKGVVSFVGQNGTGKSTLLLLAAGLLFPTKGNIFIENINTSDFSSLEDRQKYVSVIYQNMEFESEVVIGDLLKFVYENGYYEKKNENMIPDLIKVFELENILDKKTQEVSKGELQRTIIAFSLLYGSKIIMMDEPIFALENNQKIKALEFLKKFSHEYDITIYYSLHDLELSKKYSDFTLLFYKDKQPVLGPTCMMHEKEVIEEAFQVPYTMLKNKERLFRESLMKITTS